MTTDTTKVSITAELPKVKKISSAPTRANRPVTKSTETKLYNTDNAKETLIAQLEEKKKEYKTIKNILKKDKLTLKDKEDYSRMRHPIKDKASKIGEYVMYAGLACCFFCSGGALALCVLATAAGASANYNCNDFIQKEALKVTDDEVKKYYTNKATNLLAEIETLKTKTAKNNFLAEI